MVLAGQMDQPCQRHIAHLSDDLLLDRLALLGANRAPAPIYLRVVVKLEGDGPHVGLAAQSAQRRQCKRPIVR